MVQFLFYGTLHILPDGQRLPQGVDPPKTITSLYTIDALLHGQIGLFWTATQHLIMPVMVLTYGSLAVVTRMVRGGMIEVLNQDYIRTARAKGLAQSTVVNSHALKNALIPTVTMLGLQSATMLGGSVVVETVFGLPGIGRLAYDAVLQRDVNTLLGIVFASALMVIFDSIMKVARPPMMAARVFVETQIPRVTRAMIAGQTEAVEKSIWYTTVVCAIGSLVVAAIVLMKGQLIFQILLGPNNIVEPDFFPVAAGIILAATSYQPISAFLSYGDFQSAVRKFALTSIVGFSVCSLSIHYSGGGARDILWFYVIYCSACLLIGAVLLHLQLGDRRIQSLEKIP